MMETLVYFWREASLAYYQWALRSICPLHPDVPWIVQEINRLTAVRIDARRELERRRAAKARAARLDSY